MLQSIFQISSTAVPLEYDDSNVISLDVVRDSKKEKKVRYNKDGSVSRVKSYKVAGKESEVYAFRTKEEISAMINVLDRHIEEATTKKNRQIAHRNKLLFLIGINVGIRASDLRTLRWNFFFDKKNEELEFKRFYVLQPIKQRKQKKFVKLFFNQTVQVAINNYISEYPIKSLDDYLFFSNKDYDEPIAVKSLWRIIKETADEAGIKQNIGSHSLRKTFGFWCWHQAEDKNKALVILQQIFNHSTTQVTSRYIGILDDELEDMFHSIDLGLDNI